MWHFYNDDIIRITESDMDDVHSGLVDICK